jgi:hypothetical protein
MNNKVGYYHQRNDTQEIFYVGIGEPTRPYEEDSRNFHWRNVVEKFDYKVILVKENITWEEACEWEKSEIKRIGRRDLSLGPLVNMTDGGEGTQGVIITEERKKNVSEGTKRAMQDPVLRQKLKDKKVGFIPWNNGLKGIFVGEENPNFGNKWSEEQKSIQGKKLQERYKDGFSEEHLMKLKEKRKGRKPSAKLKKEDVRWIRKNYNSEKSEHTYKYFAQKFNVSKGTIHNIILRKTWADI